MIRSVPLGTTIDVMSHDAVKKVHEATLSVLETTGVRMTSTTILTRLADAGALVDLDEQRVRFPAHLVEDAIERVPSQLFMAARDPDFDFVLDGTRAHLTMDGSAAEVLDLETGAKRPSTKADLGRITRIADALPEISFLWQGVAARDVPAWVQAMHETHVQFQNTGKHIQQMTAVSPEQARGVVEMAAVVAGGTDILRERPIVSSFQCSISPLCYDGDPIEASIVYAEAGVPSGFMVMPISCATAPASVAGTLAVSNAEVLAGIATVELLVPGAPTFYGSCATTMDLRSGAATCGGPEDIFYQAAGAQLARHYGIRSCIGTFATGSKASDWQAGTENAISAVASALGGADMMCGAGLLYAARVYSAAQLLLDTEVFGFVADLLGGFSFDEEAMAAELIAQVGPAGHYLAQRHTLDHMRDFWQTRFFDRATWEDWDEAGRPGPMSKASVEARRILEEHEPPALPHDVNAELEDIIARYVVKARPDD